MPREHRQRSANSRMKSIPASSQVSASRISSHLRSLAFGSYVLFEFLWGYDLVKVDPFETCSFSQR